MKSVLALLLLGAWMGGCAVLPPVGPPTGGRFIVGPEARSLASRAAAYPLVRMCDGEAVGFLVADNVMLSARHVIRDGSLLFDIGGSLTNVNVIAAGSGRTAAHDWSLVSVDMAASRRVCEFAWAPTMKPRQEAILVTYDPVHGAEGRPAVAIAGKVASVPWLFRQALGARVCLDFGEYRSSPGMSGSPVLVRDPGATEWQLGGVYVGRTKSWGSREYSIAAPLPRDLGELIRDGGR